jgi:hypothetical protein
VPRDHNVEQEQNSGSQNDGMNQAGYSFSQLYKRDRPQCGDSGVERPKEVSQIESLQSRDYGGERKSEKIQSHAKTQESNRMLKLGYGKRGLAKENRDKKSAGRIDGQHTNHGNHRKHQESGIYHSVKLCIVAMSVVLGYMLGEGAYDSQVGKGGQAIERQKNGPDSKTRGSNVSQKKGRKQKRNGGKDDQPQRTGHRVSDNLGAKRALVRKGRTNLGFERGHGCLLYKTVSRPLSAEVALTAPDGNLLLRRGIIDIDHA